VFSLDVLDDEEVSLQIPSILDELGRPKRDGLVSINVIQTWSADGIMFSHPIDVLLITE
jgi:hypothetical protein